MFLFACCKREQCRESVKPASIEMKVERLEEELFQSTSAVEVEHFLDRHRMLADMFLDARQYPSDSILAYRMYQLIKNPSIDTLYQESIRAPIVFNQALHDLEEGLGRLKYFYPETKIPIVQTVVTGLYKDIFISEDYIIIGMDFFVGQDATFKPLDIPNYILKRYNIEHLPSIIIKFISSQYVKPGKGEDLLTEMIDFGKNYYLLSKLLPCTPERVLIGYTKEEWDDVFAHDKIIWANFIQNEWLYETNYSIKQKFLGERPNVYEIGDKCPGRIGVWLGWQIVNAYMEKSNVTMQELLTETDHKMIFMTSQYKPES